MSKSGTQKNVPSDSKTASNRKFYSVLEECTMLTNDIALYSLGAQEDAYVRGIIDHFKKVIDFEGSRNRGHFLSAIFQAFAHADLANSGAMLPLMRYLEKRFDLKEESEHLAIQKAEEMKKIMKE